MKILLENPDVTKAVELTSHGFVQPITDELIADVEAHIRGDLVMRILDNEHDVGFATFEVHDELLYLCGIMLDPTAQGRSYAREAIHYARKITNTRYLGLRTQNPKMWAVGRRLCEVWLPDVQAEKPDSEMQQVIDLLKIKRNLPHPLDLGCYGEPLYGAKPEHQDPAIQRWWDEMCNFERGDGIVCVGRLNPTHR